MIHLSLIDIIFSILGVLSSICIFTYMSIKSRLKLNDKELEIKLEKSLIDGLEKSACMSADELGSELDRMYNKK